ncbi:hypothetical protein [Arthrobacter castelli]|uniref:hypothetical protein n=1 Tax=Arthrobacter castelli TaxID=271431 RepID=UPI000427C61E|nr:hypothetical protein [Arthrobacter castelli]
MNRHSAMIIMDVDHGPGDAYPGLADAARRSATLLDDLASDLSPVHDRSTTELVAIGPGGTIRREFDLPRSRPEYSPAGTPIGEIQHLFANGKWHTPEDCPPPPSDDNGATAWQWLFYNVMQEVDDSNLCFLWDFQPEARPGAA